MPSIRRITRDDPLYQQAVDLRNRVLLGPIGYTLEKLRKEYPGFEEKLEHFVAVIDHPKGPRVVGNVCLLPGHPAAGSGRLTQMCVDPQRQGEGLGQQLLSALERRAFGELGLGELYCHAQDTAIGFYQRLGWSTDGDGFVEAGLPHHKMIFRPDARPDLVGTEQIADEDLSGGPILENSDNSF